MIPAGLWLTAHSAPGLIWIGLAGLVVGWAYSAPPLKLQSRGLGEFGITAGWLLVVVGTDFVQRRGFAFAPVAAGLGFALLVANVLYINQFPDVRRRRSAPASARSWSASVSSMRAGATPLIAALCYGWVAAMIATGRLPSLALVVPAAGGERVSRRCACCTGTQPNRQALAPAIKMTILAAALHGLLLAAALSSLQRGIASVTRRRARAARPTPAHRPSPRRPRR